MERKEANTVTKLTNSEFSDGLPASFARFSDQSDVSSPGKGARCMSGILCWRRESS